MTLKLFRSWLHRLGRRGRYAEVRFVSSMDEVPDKPGPTIFIVERGDSRRWVVLACPCNCGRRIDVNLMQSKYPYWEVMLRKGKVSLRPSLRMPTHQCGSHFWIDENRVRWIPNIISPERKGSYGKERPWNLRKSEDAWALRHRGRPSIR
jgi:hypothetical protein